MPNQEYIKSILQSIQQNWPESYQLLSPSVLRLHRIHSKLNHDLEQVIKHYHLQEADFSVLATLRRNPPPYSLSPTTLYSSMLFSSGGLTKVLTRITDANLVLRVDNPEDKRSKLVQLTAKGKQLVEQIRLELDKKERKNLQRLSVPEQQQLNQLLTKLLNSWES